MSAQNLGWRLVRGALMGLAAYGIAGVGLLALHQSVAAFWLPLALGLGVLASRTADAAPVGAVAPRALRGLGALVLAITLAALVYGAIATPARHWDGFVAWELKATALAAAPTLDQPYFADHAVFAQSRDYPLLQPLVQAALQRLTSAAGGRLLFVALWALLVGLTFLTLRRAGQAPTHGWLAALGLGLLPMLVSPTSGAVDSGYGELAILLALTTVGAGLLLDDAMLLGAGCVLLVLLKPEGSVYAGAVVFCTWLHGTRRLHVGAVVGTALALAVWLPVFTFLQHGPQVAAQTGHGLRLLLLIVAATLLLLSQPPATGRARTWRIAGLGVIGVGIGVSVLLVVPSFGGALASYFDNLRALPGRATRVPQLLLALGEQAISIRRFGLLFPLLACAWLGRARTGVGLPARRLAWLLGLGGLMVSASMLLSPETDFDHHIRSSLDRLILQWSGICVLCIAAWLPAQRQDNAARMPSP